MGADKMGILYSVVEVGFLPFMLVATILVGLFGGGDNV
jgi:hypothetical protein